MPSPKASSLSELNESINNCFKKLVSAGLNALKEIVTFISPHLFVNKKTQ
jgi:hypothetical protein